MPFQYDDAMRQIYRQQTTKAGLRSASHQAVVGAIVALVLACLLGTGLVQPLPADAAAVTRASTAVQEVRVPASDLESVGIPGGVSPPILLPHRPVLTAAGKVEVAYVGGGWCPYCALANWPLQVALSQFGTFTQLGEVLSSSPAREYPGVKSWSFTASHYVSKYFKLVAFEAPQYFVPPPMGLNALMAQYDGRPYTPQPVIPFIDLGGHFLVIGNLSTVAPLWHLSLTQVASSLRHPASAVARTVDGTADYIVAAMCLTPGASTASICASNFSRRLDAKWAPSLPATTTTSTSTTSTSTTSATMPTTTTTSTTTTVPTTTTSSTTTTTSATSSSTTTTAQP
jgi:Domain of unknown function (DUF929)